MKLEAVDKKNPTFICVATVTDMVDNRFLVHFDNWDESYDYWYDVFVCILVRCIRNVFALSAVSVILSRLVIQLLYQLLLDFKVWPPK